jgi:uncharacterized LabA/DUF88 family protein
MSIGVFIDTSNLYHCARRVFNSNISFAALLDKIKQDLDDQELVARSYGTYIGDQYPSKFVHNLVQLGIIVSYKLAREVERGIFKSDCDVAIVVEIIKQVNNFDTFVLCSGDGDFAPLIQYLRDLNKKVYVFGINVSNDLKVICPCFELTENELYETAKIA